MAMVIKCLKKNILKQLNLNLVPMHFYKINQCQMV